MVRGSRIGSQQHHEVIMSKTAQNWEQNSQVIGLSARKNRLSKTR